MARQLCDFERRVQAWAKTLRIQMQTTTEEGRVVVRASDGAFLGSLPNVEVADIWFDGFTAALYRRLSIGDLRQRLLDALKEEEPGGGGHVGHFSRDQWHSDCR